MLSLRAEACKAKAKRIHTKLHSETEDFGTAVAMRGQYQLPLGKDRAAVLARTEAAILRLLFRVE